MTYPFLHSGPEGHDERVLCCPACRTSGNTHIDHVMVVRSRYPEPPQWVMLNSYGESVEPVGQFPMPEPAQYSVGLVGVCEECGGRFLIGCEQYKGTTRLHLTRLGREKDLLDPEFRDSFSVPRKSEETPR